MNADTLPKPVASDAQTVTIRRADWDAYVALMENASDVAVVQEYAAWVGAIGNDEAGRLSYTPAEASSVLDGEHVISIWRRRLGLSQRSLATRAGVSPSYLAEIEAGKKPGSAVAIRALAQVLKVPMEMLVD